MLILPYKHLAERFAPINEPFLPLPTLFLVSTQWRAMEKHLQACANRPVSVALKPVRIQTSTMCLNFSLYGTQPLSLPHSATVLCPSFLKQLVPLSLDFRLLGCPTISALMGSRKVDFINCFFLLLEQQGITLFPPVFYTPVRSGIHDK